MQQVRDHVNREQISGRETYKGEKNHLGEVNVRVKLIAIRMDIVEIQHGGVKWIQVATDRIQKQDFVQNLTLSLKNNN